MAAWAKIDQRKRENRRASNNSRQQPGPLLSSWMCFVALTSRHMTGWDTETVTIPKARRQQLLDSFSLSLSLSCSFLPSPPHCIILALFWPPFSLSHFCGSVDLLPLSILTPEFLDLAVGPFCLRSGVGGAVCRFLA